MGKTKFAILIITSMLVLGIGCANFGVAGAANDATVPSLTVKTLQAAIEYGRAKTLERHEALLKSIMARRAKMLAQIKSDPKSFISNALSAATVSQFPTDAQQYLEKKVNLRGTIQVEMTDYSNGTSETSYSLKNSSDGIEYNLNFGGAIPKMMTGTLAQASGFALDNELALVTDGSDTSSEFKTLGITAPTPPATGDHKVLAMLVNFSDDRTQPWTVDQVKAIFFTTPQRSLNEYYKEASFGQMSFSGDVFGYYQDPEAGANYSLAALQKGANAAAAAAGFDVSKYQHLIYILNKTGNGILGVSSLGGSPSTSRIFKEGVAFSVIAHETGHSIGMQHAGTYNCGSKGIDVAANCTLSEYGDMAEIMGYASHYHLNAAHKASLGWIPSSRLTEVTTSGNYTIYPLETISSGSQALVIDKPDSSGKYFIDYRQPVGIDSDLAAAMTSGVNIISKNGVIAYSAMTYRYDATPGDNSFNNSSLTDGKSFVDPINGVTITQISHDAKSATVNVAFGQGTCVRKAPELTITPASQQGPALVKGSENAIYALALKNNDSPTCGASTFVLSATALSGWKVLFDKPTISTAGVAQGQSALVLATVYPYTSVSGNYQFTVTVSDKYLTSSPYNDSATATYVIGSGPLDTTLPTVSVTSPTNNATLTSVPFTISAAASDNVAVTKVELNAGSYFLGTSYSPPYTFTWPTYIPYNGAYSLVAKAYDGMGNIGTSNPVAITLKLSANADTQAPTVRISAPTNGTVCSNTPVTFSVSATDNVGVTKVEFYDGTTLLATDTTSPYSYSWAITSANNGNHSLTAKAYDAAGNVGTSSVAVVTVNIASSDTIAPTVSLTAPANGTSYSSAQTVAINATATDNTDVTKVEFYDGATLLATDTASPYSYSWAITAASNGTHSLTAKAYDAAGNSTVSGPVSVTINIASADTIAPTVSLASPANNSTVSGTVNLSATASDNIGVSRVDFYVDGALTATDSTSPYSYSWDTLAVARGTHFLTAKAYDAAGNVGTAAVNVTVDNTVISASLKVAITAPAADSTVSGIVSIQVTTASKSKTQYTVLYIDGKYITSAVPKYSSLQYNWNTAGYANGAHTIKAVIGNSMNIAASTTINVTVNNSSASRESLDSIAQMIQSIQASLAGILAQMGK